MDQDPATPGLLRRVCLCLRLTLFATSLTAQKSNGEHSREPTLVRLGKREVQQRTAALLAKLIPLLPTDPQLNGNDALRSLLLTEAHLVMRFDTYARYPTSLWKLTRKFNVAHYASDIVFCPLRMSFSMLVIRWF